MSRGGRAEPRAGVPPGEDVSLRDEPSGTSAGEAGPGAARDGSGETIRAADAERGGQETAKARGSGFPARKEASAGDIERARSASTRIAKLASAELSAPAIGRILHLPVAAVEAVLADEPRAPASYDEFVEQRAANSEPGWPMSGRPSFRASPSGRELTARNVYDSLARTLEMSGLRKDAAALAVERFQYYPADDYARLAQILADLGAPQQVTRSAIGLYREQTGQPERMFGKGEDEDPNSKLKRQLNDDLEARLLMARIRAVEREAQPTPASSPEIDELRRQVAALTAEKAAREQRDSLSAMLSAQVAPLSAAIEELRKTSTTFNSLDQVQVDAERRRVLTQDRAVTGLVEVLTEKAKASGSLQMLAKTLIHTTTPEIQSAALTWVRELKVPDTPGAASTPAEAPVPTPGPEDLGRAAAMLGRISGGPRP